MTVQTLADLVEAAVSFGFDHAAPLDPALLVVRQEVRAMCAADLCHAFNRNWMCPPAVGGLDEHRQVIGRFNAGLLVQTTAVLEDPFDYVTMHSAGELQKRRLVGFREHLRRLVPEVLALGNGACTLCRQCTYPDRPCRRPSLAVESMEAFGLVVADVCQASHLPYNHGEGTITYTGCYLFTQAA